MQLKIQISLALAILLSLSGHVKADCNVCSATFPFACVAPDKVRLCVDGSPTGDVLFCGEGNQCDVDGICRPADQVIAVSCDECNKCDANRVFACTSPTSFALCLGNENPSPDITGECSEGYVCSRNSKEICTKVNGATCPYNFEPPTEAPPTEPPAPPNPKTHPNEFCAFMGQATRYPVGTDEATDCRRYIQCFETNNGWVGAPYLCAGGAYFHDNFRGCQTTLPARCSVAVRSLTFSP